MTWEWSHSVEGILSLRENLEEVGHEELTVIYAEWETYVPNACWDEDFNNGYSKALEEAAGMPDDILRDFIWEKAENQRLCTNGGFQAWMCPYGCHLLSF